MIRESYLSDLNDKGQIETITDKNIYQRSGSKRKYLEEKSSALFCIS